MRATRPRGLRARHSPAPPRGCSHPAAGKAKRGKRPCSSHPTAPALQLPRAGCGFGKGHGALLGRGGQHPWAGVCCWHPHPLPADPIPCLLTPSPAWQPGGCGHTQTPDPAGDPPQDEPTGVPACRITRQHPCYRAGSQPWRCPQLQESGRRGSVPRGCQPSPRAVVGSCTGFARWAPRCSRGHPNAPRHQLMAQVMQAPELPGWHGMVGRMPQHPALPRDALLFFSILFLYHIVAQYISQLLLFSFFFYLRSGIRSSSMT